MYTPGVVDFQSLLAKYVSWTSVHLALPMGIVIAAYHIGAAIIRQPGMRPLVHRLVLRVPNFGYASKERSLASFSRILWRLQSAGILPIQAWDAASRAAENVVIATRLYEQVETIRSGKKFSEALAATGLFSSEDQRVLAAAELAGSTGDILQRIAAYHEDAAISAVGRTRWMIIRVLIMINVLSIAAIGYATIRQVQNQFDWVDWFMKSE
jgi:type IV pilus assembly protein PilC